MDDCKIGFVGAGNMAYAIAGGCISSGKIKASEIGFFDVNEERCALFSDMGMRRFSSSRALAGEVPVLFLAIKPQTCTSVLEEISDTVTAGTVLVSIMAGISTVSIAARLKTPCGVIRAMPNTPLLIGCGATALSRSALVSDEQYALVSDIFETLGIVEHLPEERMNAVISVNASSPAYVYLFAKAMIDGAAEQGIDAETAKRLVGQTLLGSARMILESGHEPQALIDMVTSPGGTTFKALEGLRDHGFEEGVQDAMRRCTERAEELGF